jgi:hypothetical protein
MRVSAKVGTPGTRARIEILRLRVPAGDARSAKALAMTLAPRLASRVGELGSGAGREPVRTRVTAPAAVSRGRLADSIVGAIANSLKQGRR